MEPRFQTSFIPKKPLVPGMRPAGRRIVGLFSLASVIIFVSIIALAAGVFLYQQFLLRSIESMKQSLDRARAAFEPALLEELKRLDSRIETSKKLLETHTAMTPVFQLLETNTLRNIRFSTFKYSLGKGGVATLAMDGEARSFSAIALQADLLASRHDFKNPVFADLSPEEDGFVGFTFNGAIDQRLVLYGPTVGSIVPGAEGTSTLVQ